MDKNNLGISFLSDLNRIRYFYLALKHCEMKPTKVQFQRSPEFQDCFPHKVAQFVFIFVLSKLGRISKQIRPGTELDKKSRIRI